MKTLICTGNKGKLLEFQHAFQGKCNLVGLNSLPFSPNINYVEPIENSDYFIFNAAVKLFSALQFLVLNFEESISASGIERILVDDSGLCVPQLNYLPGVHSATYGGLPKSDIKNNAALKEKILQSKYAKIHNIERRLDAFFVCFLLSIDIKDSAHFSFLKDEDLTQSKNLLDSNKTNAKEIIDLEQQLLNEVDFKNAGGSLSQKLSAKLFFPNFTEGLFINISYGFCCGEVSSQEQCLIPGAGHGYDPLFYPLTNLDLSFASIPLAQKNEQSHRANAMREILRI